MKTYFYEWTQNLAYYMVILTIVMQLLPSDNYKKYVQFFVGLLLIVMMMGPIFRILDVKDSFLEFYSSVEHEQKRKEMEDATRYLEEISPATLWKDD